MIKDNVSFEICFEFLFEFFQLQKLPLLHN